MENRSCHDAGQLDISEPTFVATSTTVSNMSALTLSSQSIASATTEFAAVDKVREAASAAVALIHDPRVDRLSLFLETLSKFNDVIDVIASVGTIHVV